MAVQKATGVHKIHSTFSTSGGVLTFYRDNASTQLAFGESDSGLDVKFYGDTASAYMLWDESADTLYGASSAILDWDGSANFVGAVTASGTVTFTNSIAVTDMNIALASTTGTQLGTAATQKLGFLGATPIVQKAAGTAVSTVVIDFGLMASA